MIRFRLCHQIPQESLAKAGLFCLCFPLVGFPALPGYTRVLMTFLTSALMDKKQLTETEIRTRFITPALYAAGWDKHKQIREEYSVSAGRIQVRGRMHSRGAARRADYVLCFQPNQPIAVLEAKDNKHSLGNGIQQATRQILLILNNIVIEQALTQGSSHATNRYPI